MNNLEKCTMPEVYRHNVIQYLFSGMSRALQIDCNDLAESALDSPHIWATIFNLRALSCLDKNKDCSIMAIKLLSCNVLQNKEITKM